MNDNIFDLPHTLNSNTAKTKKTNLKTQLRSTSTLYKIKDPNI